MKILHRYILHSHLLGLIMTLATFTFVLLLGNIFKDILDLLSNQTVTLGEVSKFFLLLMPYVLSFSMPMALLAATLLVMGRISADQELNAARASGIAFFQMIRPIFGVAVVVSLICLYINSFLAPQCKHQFNQTFIELVLSRPIALLEEGQYIKDFPDMEIFIGKKDVKTNRLENIRVHVMANSIMKEDIYAESGALEVDRERMKIHITLHRGHVEERKPENPLSFENRMTFFEDYPLELDLSKLVDQRRTVKDDSHTDSRELWQQIVEFDLKGILATPKLVELHKRMALAVACFSFVMIGIPLGVQVQRKETSIGILVSLILAALYYLLILFAEAFRDRPHLYPEFIVWLPNLLFQFIGLFLLWKQSKI